MPTTIPFEELSGPGANTYEASGGRATRTLVCEFARAADLCCELVGSARPVGAFQRRTTPARHPRRPWLRVHRATFEGFGSPRDDGTAISYTKAKVTVEYRAADESRESTSDTCVTERRVVRPTVEKSPLVFKWSGGPDAGNAVFSSALVELPTPQLIVLVDVHHWFEAPIETGVFESLVGTVNASELRPRHATWPAGTLLYEGANYERDWTADGRAGWRVRLQFAYRGLGWNRLRAVNGSVQEIATASGALPYETAEHRVLIPAVG